MRCDADEELFFSTTASPAPSIEGEVWEVGRIIWRWWGGREKDGEGKVWGNRRRVTFIPLPILERALSPSLFQDGVHHVAISSGILTKCTFLQHCLHC